VLQPTGPRIGFWERQPAGAARRLNLVFGVEEGAPMVEEVRRRGSAADLGRAFLAGAILTWVGFLLTFLPVGPDRGIARGAVAGCFAGAVVFGTIGAGAGAWAAVRARWVAWVWAALLFAPVCLLCWWRLLTWE
jgi:hypothetical protein